MTWQSDSDTTGAEASGKPQGRQSVSDRAAEGDDPRVEAMYAEEGEAAEAAAEAAEQRIREEEQKTLARAVKTAQDNQQAAERKREAAVAESREKAARAEQQQKETGGAAASGGGGSDSGGSGSGGSASTGISADESRLISLLNERRAALGLPAVAESADLAGEAEECSARSLANGALEHCGHEVLFMGGSGNTPEAMIEAWFNSPGHKTALTYESSTQAGAAIVTNSAGRLVAAININY